MLNEEQLAAANANLGKNLIIASAGTGKTSTIIARIEHLINEGAKPDEIMLLTFTNKAAKEMMQRLSNKLGNSRTKGIISGTFHAVCLEFIKKHKNIQLKKQSQLRNLLKTIYEKFSPNLPNLYDYSYLAEILSKFNNTCINENFYEWFCKNYQEQVENASFYCKVLEIYEEQKKAQNYYDFDDLLLEFRKNIKIYLKDKEFVEVLVDEYQDTNNLQSSILDAISKKSLFCVGDYDQSIYAFNGANIEIIASFKDRYQDAKIYSLNKNYRSSAKILEFANRVIERNERLYPKKLIVTRTKECAPIKFHTFNYASEQYDYVASQIAAKDWQNSDIAVIYRNNSSGDAIERSLKMHGVKTSRKGGNSFYELKEISALLSLVNISKHKNDILSFLDVLLLTKGVGPAKTNSIYKGFLELGNGVLLDGILRPIKKENYEFLDKFDEKFGLFAKDENEKKQLSFSYLKSDFKHNPILLLPNFSDENVLFLEELYNFLKRNEKENNPFILLKNALNSRIFYLIANNIASSRSFKNARIDKDLKEEKFNAIYKNANFVLEDAKNFSTFAEFSEKITLLGDLSNSKGVSLLTVHASKGLEFDSVYLIDLANGRFPNTKLCKNAGGIDEERRLFYVALTRAKNELCMSYAKRQKADDKELPRSIFIDEGAP